MTSRQMMTVAGPAPALVWSAVMTGLGCLTATAALFSISGLLAQQIVSAFEGADPPLDMATASSAVSQESAR
ncbi:hypothetical protein ABT001_26710 [Streptomyces sp. NPDC002793]|uniref:hypothetical protein n=1 Tax=Streptomyces sp. NPDC002793 TaxID=3154432 RepID=UPI003328B6C5